MADPNKVINFSQYEAPAQKPAVGGAIDFSHYSDDTDYSSMSPQDLASKAMRGSGVTGTQRLAPTAPKIDMQESPNMTVPSAALGAYHEILSPTGTVGKFHKAVEENIQGAAKGIGDMIVNADPTPVGIAQYILKGIAESPHPAATALGVNGEAIEKSANPSGVDNRRGTQPPLDKEFPQPDFASLAGHSAVPLVLSALGGERANTAKERLFAKPPATKASIAEIIADKINPHPDERPTFQENVEQHLDAALNERGKPITNRSDLGTAFKARAVAAKKAYDTLVKPVQDERVSTTGIPGYAGGVVNEGRNTATLRQLEQRLGIINNTLNATYEKGGLAAQSALGAEAKVALNSEAHAIRNLINEETASRLKIKPEDVAAARQAYGATGNVADKIRWYLDNEKYSSNKVANQPTQAPDITFIGAANMARKAAWDRIAGNPADKAVKNAFEFYRPTPNSPLLTNYTPPAPIVGRGVPKQTKPPINVQVTPPAEIQAATERMQNNLIQRGANREAAPPQWRQMAKHYESLPSPVQEAIAPDTSVPAFLQEAIDPQARRVRNGKEFSSPSVAPEQFTGTQADVNIPLQTPAHLPQIGTIVDTAGGKRVRITVVHPDGSFDGEIVHH